MRLITVAALLFIAACGPGPLPPPPKPLVYDRATDGFPTIGDDRFTPLGRAILNDDLDAVRRVLEEGANPNIRSGSRGDYHPLTIALLADSFGAGPRPPERRALFVRLLLQHGADPNARWCPFESRGTGEEKWPTCRSALGTTALINAASFGWATVVDLLLTAGAEPGLRDWSGGSAIDYATDERIIHRIGRAMFASEAGRNSKILALMSEYKGNTTTRLERALARGFWSGSIQPPPPPPPGDKGQYALQETVDIVTHLGAILRLGADPNERLKAHGADWTALARAIADDRLPVTRLLLDYGADPNLRWCVPLDKAAPRQQEKAQTCTTENGMTPLMFAAELNSFDSVVLLRRFGADRSLKDWAGRSALDYAKDRVVRDLLSVR